MLLPVASGSETSPALRSSAGVDRVTVQPGKTALRGWAGYGEAPAPDSHYNPSPGAPTPAGPPFTTMWSKESGPGAVRFADAQSPHTTATFSKPGEYVLRLTAQNGQAKSTSTLRVTVELSPPVRQLEAVHTKHFKLHSKFWDARRRALVVNWIPHCIEVINRSDVKLGPGGIDNFVEAAKKLRGEKAGLHKGFVFSNAWVHQTVEAMSIALMVDAQGDAEIRKAHEKFRATLEDWIPKILAAQEPDGYLQTAFTLDRPGRDGKIVESSKFGHWDPKHRGDHEGYVAGYFIESAINHYLMTGKQDARLYNAAKKLADCWHRNLGPSPRKPWYDGHQQMEQALVRFGRFVNEVEGGGKGDQYVETAKFLLDCRATSAPGRAYDQAHLPVTQQYEALGHAVRAAYTYSAMADVAVETHDVDYQSAVRSLWDNVVHKKYYVTGGVGSEGKWEGFGPEYSLANDGYCESCSTCGMIFFHWKMNLAYHDARYIDNLEESMYNALLGSMDLAGKNFYYTNPPDVGMKRSAWHLCPCCVGNIPRTLLMVPTWAYAKSPEGVYVNLYIGSTVLLENAGGTDVEMVQQTDYPWSGKVAITVNPKQARRFAVRLRAPDWTTSKLYTPTPPVKGIRSLSVNGKPVKVVVERGYASVVREWKAGDKIELELPLAPQRILPADAIAATRGKVGLRRGPLVYNLEAVDQDIQSHALRDDSPLRAEWREDLLGGVMVIRGEFADGSPMLAIPNYARANRNPELPLEAGVLSGSVADFAGPDAPPYDAAKHRTRPATPVSVIWIRRTRS
ncbi:MAG: glycoside hydrolase family 127 protein [Bryobacter sp.]|nr:glycoside hydrolase family 127 protein [Bryobacter sp.]